MKSEIISFKVDAETADLIKLLPNKSEFIRQAVLAAMDNTCPLCQGTGSLTPAQKIHWLEFTKQHPVHTCGDCNAVTLSCRHEDGPGDV